MIHLIEIAVACWLIGAGFVVSIEVVWDKDDSPLRKIGLISFCFVLGWGAMLLCLIEWLLTKPSKRP